MATTYQVEIIHEGLGHWVDAIRRAIESELADLGLHRSVTVSVTESAPAAGGPALTLFFGSGGIDNSTDVAARVTAALGAGRVVLPVVQDLSAFSSSVPSELKPLNGIAWSHSDRGRGLARRVLEELGIEEKQRRVFISHKREDGLGTAEQLHDALAHARFAPFIDRFSIAGGARVQEVIADALEDHAFLLLLETPMAYASDWVFDEVDYALSHTMGILILQWPGGPRPVPGSNSLPRFRLAEADLITDPHDFHILTPEALDRVLEAIEASHAQGLCRRRRMLVQSVREAAVAAGCTSCLQLPDWRLLVSHGGDATLVGVTPRLPTARDLQTLDAARASATGDPKGVLVHSARMLRPDLQSHLEWVTGSRELALLPENAIGGWW